MIAYRSSALSCEPDCVYSELRLGPNDGSLVEYYGAGEDGWQGGVFRGYHSTVFASTVKHAHDAVIEQASSSIMPCLECYLVVTSNNAAPAYYLYDLSLSNWNGGSTLSLQGFWPGQGRISRVSIWGRKAALLPEPGVLLLTGAALLGIAFAHRGIVSRRQEGPRQQSGAAYLGTLGSAVHGAAVSSARPGSR